MSQEFERADFGSMDDRQAARDSFFKFVDDTWKLLVRLEQTSYLVGTPCTAVFCRLDIGVMFRNGRASYFVNEIERGLTTSLWMRALTRSTPGVLADTFGLALHKWISKSTDPHL